MKNKVLKTVLVVALITTLTIADFVLLGTKLITYALEDNNVKFNAYFKTGDGEETPQMNYEMTNSEMKLYIEVAVESGVSFDGVITLGEGSNFKFKNELSQGISKIEGNTITLEPVRVGNTAKIEVGIEPVKDENYGDDMLSKDSTLTLSGSYDAGTDTIKTITLEDTVKLNLTVPENIDTSLEGKVITNNAYQTEEGNKRIVQIELNSSVIGNVYPIGVTTFEIDLPEEVESLEVISKGTYATNGEADRKLVENTNYTWDKSSNKSQVNIENTSKDNKISWKQDATDNIVLTLILPADAEISTEEYGIKSKVQLYGQKSSLPEKEAKYNLAESENEDGIIKASISNKEIIYKGKLYSQEEREYNSTTNIEVNYANLIDGATIKEKTTYRVELDSEDLAANVQYKETTISKSEFDKILGEEGSLLIKDQDGNTVKEVKSTDFDTDGNLTITYANGVKELTIEMTKAIATGVIRLNHTKVIIEESYTEDQIDEIKYLVEQARVTYNEVDKSFGIGKNLRDITSEVTLTVPQTISAEGNKDISMSITLKTDNEKYELFENPTFTLTMPEGVTVNSVSSGAESTLYGGLAISKLEKISSREIRIELSGTQTEYIESNINSQINFTANVSVEKLMPNKVDTVKMQYQNKGNTYNIESEQINVKASNSEGIVTHLKVENYNGNGATVERYSNSEAKVTGELPLENAEVINASVTYTIINNYSSTISLMGALVANYIDKDENKQELINYVEQNITIEAGTMKVIKQELQVPADLYYAEEIDIKTLVEYTYSSTAYSTRNDISLATESKEGIRDTSIIGDKLQVETFAQYGDGAAIRKDDAVYNEQIISYIIEVTNISNETISNITVTNKQDNGNIYDLKEFEVEIWDTFEEETTAIEHRYAELETDTKVFDAFNLAPGESKELLVRVAAKKSETDNITSANINVFADNIEKQDIEKISNTVKDSDLKITNEKMLNEEVKMYANSGIQTLTYIKNLTSNEIRNLKGKVYLSDGLTFPEDYTLKVIDKESNEYISTINSINYNEDENYIEFEITSLEPGQEILLKSYLYIKSMPIQEISGAEKIYVDINDIVSNAVKIDTQQTETEFSVEQTININEGEKVKNGDIITITGKITNTGYVEDDIIIFDILPTGLEPTKVEFTRNGETTDITEESQSENVLATTEIEPGETVILTITVRVNTARILESELTNIISISTIIGNTINSNEITIQVDSYIDNSGGGYEPDEEPDDDEDLPFEKPDDDKIDEEKPDDGKTDEEKPDDGKTDEEKPDDGKQEEATYTISGYAWIDKNSNGNRDSDEAVKDVKVKIIDLNNKNTFVKDENGNEIEVKTDESGKYEIKEVSKGNYNVIFKYDTSSYELKENSKLKDYTIESTKEKVAITENITLNTDKTIDLELVELTEFNLKLDKYISKVIVQTANGTKTSTYTKQQLAREEIQKRYLVGATVLVEYTIEVSNIGELAGYTTQIVDYIPKDMKFYSELNTQWYAGEDGNLYNTALSSSAINPGETKTVKLVLSKSMTESNVGTTTNIAEISDMMNIKGYADIDLSNNQSKAEIIVNPATGMIVTYLIAVLNGIAILVVGMYIIKKKVIGKEQ